ncbi:unnamed protein product [Prunus armeniaca]
MRRISRQPPPPSINLVSLGMSHQTNIPVSDPLSSEAMFAAGVCTVRFTLKLVSKSNIAHSPVHFGLGM